MTESFTTVSALELARAALPQGTPAVLMVVDPEHGVQYLLQNMDTITLAGWVALLQIEVEASFVGVLAQRQAREQATGLSVARAMPQDHKRKARPE